MNLKTYLSAKPRGTSKDLAKLVDVCAVMVSQWASGRKAVPAARCVSIELATKGAVTRKDLRPDDWQQLWPELALKRRSKSTQQVGG